MKSVAVSEFKAGCLGLLEEVRRTRRPILVTKRGKPLAQVTAPPQRARAWRDSMKGTIRFLHDTVAPASDTEDWNVL